MEVGEAHKACQQALSHAEDAGQLLVQADSIVTELTADQAAGSSLTAAAPAYRTVGVAMGHAVAALSSVKLAACSKLCCEGCMSAACRKDDAAASAGGGGGDGWGVAEQQRLVKLRTSFRAAVRATSEVAASCCNTAEMLSKLAPAPGGGDPALPAGVSQGWHEHLAALTGADALLQQMRQDQSLCESRVGQEIASSAAATRSQLNPAADPTRLSQLDNRVTWARDVAQLAESGWDDAVQSETLRTLSQVMAARAQTEAARAQQRLAQEQQEQEERQRLQEQEEHQRRAQEQQEREERQRLQEERLQELRNELCATRGVLKDADQSFRAVWVEHARAGASQGAAQRLSAASAELAAAKKRYSDAYHRKRVTQQRLAFFRDNPGRRDDPPPLPLEEPPPPAWLAEQQQRLQQEREEQQRRAQEQQRLQEEQQRRAQEQQRLQEEQQRRAQEQQEQQERQRRAEDRAASMPAAFHRLVELLDTSISPPFQSLMADDFAQTSCLNIQKNLPDIATWASPELQSAYDQAVAAYKDWLELAHPKMQPAAGILRLGKVVYFSQLLLRLVSSSKLVMSEEIWKKQLSPVLHENVLRVVMLPASFCQSATRLLQHFSSMVPTSTAPNTELEALSKEDCDAQQLLVTAEGYYQSAHLEHLYAEEGVRTDAGDEKAVQRLSTASAELAAAEKRYRDAYHRKRVTQQRLAFFRKNPDRRDDPPPLPREDPPPPAWLAEDRQRLQEERLQEERLQEEQQRRAQEERLQEERLQEEQQRRAQEQPQQEERLQEEQQRRAQEQPQQEEQPGAPQPQDRPRAPAPPQPGAGGGQQASRAAAGQQQQQQPGAQIPHRGDLPQPTAAPSPQPAADRAPEQPRAAQEQADQQGKRHGRVRGEQEQQGSAHEAQPPQKKQCVSPPPKAGGRQQQQRQTSRAADQQRAQQPQEQEEQPGSVPGAPPPQRKRPRAPPPPQPGAGGGQQASRAAAGQQPGDLPQPTAAPEQPRAAQEQADQQGKRHGRVRGEQKQQGSAHEPPPPQKKQCVSPPPKAGGRQQQQRQTSRAADQQRAQQPQEQEEQPGSVPGAPPPQRKRPRAPPPPQPGAGGGQQASRAAAGQQPGDLPQPTAAPEQPRGAQEQADQQGKRHGRVRGEQEQQGSAHEPPPPKAGERQQQQQQQEPGAQHPQQAHAVGPDMPQSVRPQRKAAQKVAQKSAQNAAQRKELATHKAALRAAAAALDAADSRYKAVWAEQQSAEATIRKQSAGRGPEPAEQQASEAITKAKEDYAGAYQAVCLAQHAVRAKKAELKGNRLPIFEATPTPEPDWMQTTEFVDLLSDDE